jgi:hypothetical protein
MTANIFQIRLLGRGGGACPSTKARGTGPALFRGVYDGAGRDCQEKRGHYKDRALKNMEKIDGENGRPAIFSVITGPPRPASEASGLGAARPGNLDP